MKNSWAGFTAVTALAALTLTACNGGETESSEETTQPTGEFSGFDTEKEFEQALDEYACELADGGDLAFAAYSEVRKNPELSEKYNIPYDGSLRLTREILTSLGNGDGRFNCNVPWVRAGAAEVYRDTFDRALAVERGIVSDD